MAVSTTNRYNGEHFKDDTNNGIFDSTICGLGDIVLILLFCISNIVRAINCTFSFAHLSHISLYLVIFFPIFRWLRSHLEARDSRNEDYNNALMYILC